MLVALAVPLKVREAHGNGGDVLAHLQSRAKMREKGT